MEQIVHLRCRRKIHFYRQIVRTHNYKRKSNTTNQILPPLNYIKDSFALSIYNVQRNKQLNNIIQSLHLQGNESSSNINASNHAEGLYEQRLLHTLSLNQFKTSLKPYTVTPNKNKDGTRTSTFQSTGKKFLQNTKTELSMRQAESQVYRIGKKAIEKLFRPEESNIIQNNQNPTINNSVNISNPNTISLVHTTNRESKIDGFQRRDNHKILPYLQMEFDMDYISNNGSPTNQQSAIIASSGINFDNGLLSKANESHEQFQRKVNELMQQKIFGQKVKEEQVYQMLNMHPSAPKKSLQLHSQEIVEQQDDSLLNPSIYLRGEDEKNKIHNSLLTKNPVLKKLTANKYKHLSPDERTRVERLIFDQDLISQAKEQQDQLFGKQQIEIELDAKQVKQKQKNIYQLLHLQKPKKVDDLNELEIFDELKMRIAKETREQVQIKGFVKAGFLSDPGIKEYWIADIIKKQNQANLAKLNDTNNNREFEKSNNGDNQSLQSELVSPVSATKLQWFNQLEQQKVQKSSNKKQFLQLPKISKQFDDIKSYEDVIQYSSEICLDQVVQENQKEIESLKKKFEKIEPNEIESMFFDYIKNQDTLEITYMLNKYEFLRNSRDKKGDCPILSAIRYSDNPQQISYLDIVKLMVEQFKFDINLDSVTIIKRTLTFLQSNLNFQFNLKVETQPVPARQETLT